MRIRWIAAGVCGLGWCVVAAAGPGPAGRPSRAPVSKAPAGRRAMAAAPEPPSPPEASLGGRAQGLLPAHRAARPRAKGQQGGRRVDGRAGLLAKLGRGLPAVVPGHPEQSALIAAVRYDGKIRMPPQGKLPPAAQETLRRWIAAGAPWPPPKDEGGRMKD